MLEIGSYFWEILVEVLAALWEKLSCFAICVFDNFRDGASVNFQLLKGNKGNLT